MPMKFPEYMGLILDRNVNTVSQERQILSMNYASLKNSKHVYLFEM